MTKYLLSPDRSPDVTLKPENGCDKVLVWVNESIFSIDGCITDNIKTKLSGRYKKFTKSIEYLEHVAQHYIVVPNRARIASDYLAEVQLFKEWHCYASGQAPSKP